MSVESRFKKHLFKVCKDKRLRQYAMDYFADLSEFYGDRVFTRDDFEKIIIDGKEVEQDVVVALFKHKESVTAQDVFCYLFSTNIDSFAIKRSIPNLPDAVGAVDALKRTCVIKKYKREHRQPVVYMNKPTRKKLKEDKKRQKEVDMIIEDTHYRHTVYHELSHIFELKIFNNGQVIRNEMSDKTFVKVKKDFLLFYGSDVNKGILDAIRVGENYGISAQSFMTILRAQGATALSEILNEEFALDVLKKKTIIAMPTEDDYDHRYIRKTRLAGDCGYNPNYDIASLVKIALGDAEGKDVRFNGQGAVDGLGKLNVSKESLDGVKKGLMDLISKDLMTEQDREMYVEILKLLEESNSYDTLTLIMGVAGGYGPGMISPAGVTLEDYKVLAQGLLIESIKNDIIDQINNPSVIKDKAFYERINATLETIDGFICYPNTETTFLTPTHSTVPKENRILDLRTHSVSRFAKKNPSMNNLMAFADLVEFVGSSIEDRKYELGDIESIMTFYQKQHALDLRYQEEMEAQESAIRKHEEAKELREEGKEIPIQTINPIKKM